MNPISILEEVNYSFQFSEAKPEERKLLLEEAIEILQRDPVLKLPAFSSSVQNLVRQINNANQVGKPKGEHSPSSRLVQYFIAEVLNLLKSRYVEEAFGQLRDLMSSSAPQGAQTSNTIELVTGFLLSILLDKDFSLESLYQFYAQFLVPRKPLPSYNFTSQFDEVERRVQYGASTYDVTYAINAVTNSEGLPPRLGEVEISPVPPFVLPKKNHAAAQLKVRNDRLYFTIKNIQGPDLRSAGRQAYERLTNVVNLLRFEYEQNRIQVSDVFAVTKSVTPTRTYAAHASMAQAAGNASPAGSLPQASVYPIPKAVPNPLNVAEAKDGAAFVDLVNDLLQGEHLTSEGRDRITSAFRLYRQGRDQDIIETKLVNWWTAMEYLIRGDQSSGGSIGVSVENAVAPVICLGYVPKILVATRALFKPELLQNAGLVDVTKMGMADLWNYLKDPASASALLALISHDPFIHSKVNDLIQEIVNPQKLATHLTNHDRKIRWQIQRIWRTRCDIVHSAGRGANYLLLCSNLEVYLKTALHSLLGALRDLATLSGPLEFFDRQRLIKDDVVAALEKGSDVPLIATFNS